jgi:hypothetical protein
LPFLPLLLPLLLVIPQESAFMGLPVFAFHPAQAAIADCAAKSL